MLKLLVAGIIIGAGGVLGIQEYTRVLGDNRRLRKEKTDNDRFGPVRYCEYSERSAKRQRACCGRKDDIL